MFVNFQSAQKMVQFAEDGTLRSSWLLDVSNNPVNAEDGTIGSWSFDTLTVRLSGRPVSVQAVRREPEALTFS